ncbi:MAG: AraC family transcriptional regulator [Gammaproteobacteria bacterium]|nr:MAG: AraC family transcriptional regulator [Gammaproteobacteria bacterium]
MKLDNQFKFTVHSHFILPALRAAEQKGASLGLLLQGTGVSPQMLRDPQVRFTVDQHNAIVKRLWRLLDDQNLGLLPRVLPLGAFQVGCELAMNADTLDEMFRKMFYASQVINSYIQWQFEVIDGQAIIAFNFLGFEDSSRVPTEWSLLCLHRFACWVSGRSFPLQRVAFRYERPPYAEEYARLFGCPCTYSWHRQELVFEERYLKLRVIRTWRDLPEFVAHSPGILLALPSSEDNIALHVRRLLMDGGQRPAVFPSLDSLATSLGMTGQTLYRRIKSEGTSYQKIKDDIRRDLAIDLLANTQRTMAEIGEQLGFSEACSFSRAFKHWTGVPPMAYRSKAHGLPD